MLARRVRAGRSTFRQSVVKAALTSRTDAEESCTQGYRNVAQRLASGLTGRADRVRQEGGGANKGCNPLFQVQIRPLTRTFGVTRAEGADRAAVPTLYDI